MPNKWIKRLVNMIFLTFSCALIVYFLIQVTANPIIKWCVGIFAVSLDIFAQYLLALGRHKHKQHDHSAYWLFALYAVYVLVYAVPSAVGFFMVELDQQDQIASTVELNRQINMDRLKQVSNSINTLNLQLLTESKTGYGKNSQKIMSELKQLENEQKGLQIDLKSSPKSLQATAKNVFKCLSKPFGLPEGLVTVFIFTACVISLYVGLILTSWDLSENVTRVTQTVTGEKIDVTKCVCGCGRPRKPGRKYFDDSCKQKAYRMREAIREG